MSRRKRKIFQGRGSTWTKACRRHGKLGEKRGLGGEQSSGKQGCGGA